MKRHTVTIGIVALGLSALLIHDCRAAEITGKGIQTAVAPAKVPPAPAVKDADNMITVTTGTRLPQKVRRAGQITDSGDCLTVIDSKTIARSGAGDLAQALRRVAGVSVRGP
jgi:outer membrane cobalamin receptor